MSDPGAARLSWSTATAVLGAGVVLGGLGVVLSAGYGAGVPWPVCLVAGVVLTAAGSTGHAVLRTTHVESAPPRPRPPPAPLGDLGVLRARLVVAGRDQQRFDERVRPELARLTAEVLRQRHGIDWLTAPARARELLGPLWPLLSAPSGSLALTVGDLQRWLDRLEQL